MTAVPVEQLGQFGPLYPVIDVRPNLSLVPEPAEGALSRNAFDVYFTLRDEAIATPKVDGDALFDIQASAALHFEGAGLLDLPNAPEERFSSYTDFKREDAYKRISGLVDYLEQNHPNVSKIELDTTRAFLESTYAMYDDRPQNGEVMADADGSFAFVVPARVGRRHPDYGQEVEPAIPALRYVPNELRAAFLVGLPPFVIDMYEQNENGKRGYLVLAPVFEDMREDLASTGEVMKAARQNVNAAVDFAHRRFGIHVAGLGATLPALTHFGKKVTNPNVVTTTGHGGTVSLINMTVEMAARGKDVEKIGVLGLGSIGEAIARNMLEQYPEADVVVYENDPNRAAKILAENPKLIRGESEKDVLESSQIIVSAITSQLDLKGLGITSMEGKVIVDDSQPGSVSPAQLQLLGGDLLWVIGTDPDGKTVRRRGYDYGTMVNARQDVFGCEAEAASIARYQAELAERGMPQGAVERIIAQVALRGPVSLRNVRYINALFMKFGILSAAPQAFGHSVDMH